MKTAFLGASLAAIVGSVATADVTYSFTSSTWAGFNFTEIFAAGSLTGILTGVSANATLEASTNYTYADDLCIYMAPTPLAYGGPLQAGGYSNLNAGQRYWWANGGSSTPGTSVISEVTLTTSIDMDASPTQSIWLGNGYGASGTSGTWTGSVTLIGVNNVPAPGAVALLGLAGLVGRRRRS